MKANKHLLLWSSVGTLAVFLWAAVNENFLTDWRVIQLGIQARLPASQADTFTIQLRQIVSREVGATDRCVSCHVGMAPGESGIEGDRIFGRHADVVHDPASYGCAVCHGGQGRATETADAHGTVPHWPEPMLSKEYLFAGCGGCHTHLSVPNLTQLERGKARFEQADCLACHKLDGRGGTLRPGGAGGQEGPDLSRVGAYGFKADWYEHHINQRKKPASGPWVSAFGALSKSERLAIDEYLRSRVGAPGLSEAKALFHTLGCRGCHKVRNVGGDDGPDLTAVGNKDPGQVSFAQVEGERTLANWFKKHFRSPASVVPGSTMPEFRLTERQIDQLTVALGESEYHAATILAFDPDAHIAAGQLAGHDEPYDRRLAGDAMSLRSWAMLARACCAERLTAVSGPLPPTLRANAVKNTTLSTMLSARPRGPSRSAAMVSAETRSRVTSALGYLRSAAESPAASGCRLPAWTTSEAYTHAFTSPQSTASARSPESVAITVAANAGCASVGVSYGAHEPGTFAEFSPLHVAHSVKELRDWLAANA